MIMKALAWVLVLLSLAACAGNGAGAAPVLQGSSATVAPSVEHGKMLFRNNGCVTCHVNNRVPGDSGVVKFGAPNLTGYSDDSAFLRRWLADPSGVKPGTGMPNLHLSAAEIEDLIAFLNEPR